LSSLERIAGTLPEGAWTEVAARDGMTTLSVERDRLRDVFTSLKESCGYETSTLVTAIDHHPRTPRFELLWQFLSLTHNDRVRVSCRVPEEDAHVPTLVDLWPGAAYGERVTFDMFGIIFDGHENLRRLLMPQGYDHHPLRKDFPHHGIEPDRLYREWERARS
jgi:NADH-quinone oxidoreductase subunit C